MLKNYFDLPIKVIYGYKGTKGVSLAMQQGEVVAMGGMFESSVKGSFALHVDAGNLKVFASSDRTRLCRTSRMQPGSTTV